METSATAAPHARELSFVRFLMASPEQVFDAWIRPERLRRWWGPEDFKMVTCELEPRPGGPIRLELRSPEGRVHGSRGIFHEVDRPVRLSFTEVLDEVPQEAFVTTVTFEELGAMTRMTVSQTAAMQEPLASWQPVGWQESLARLSALLLPT